MTTGGARFGSGPKPGPDSSIWLRIPNTPPSEPIPAFPLPDPIDRELYIWNVLWEKPQARQWHKHSQQYEVALYTRRFVEAEKPKSSISLNTLIRQLADSLGITSPGMRANRWLIVDDVIEVDTAIRDKTLSYKEKLALKAPSDK